MYKLEDKSLTPIKELDFNLEKDIQNLCESNLNIIFGLELVKPQFVIEDIRMDTLAFDNKNKSFVIIEYKKDKNLSVIDQGYTYLSKILNNKAECIVEYNENKRESIRRDDIDWTQTKIIFVSPSFSQYQIQATNFKDLPIELWEIKIYTNNTVRIEQINPSSTTESIKTISKNSAMIKRVNTEVKVYTEEDHLNSTADDIKELYETLKTLILNIGSGRIKIKPVKNYIGFIANTNFVDIHIQKKALKIWINMSKGTLDDPKGIARDVSGIGHWGNGDYEIQINNTNDIEYIMTLAKQSYKKNT